MTCKSLLAALAILTSTSAEGARAQDPATSAVPRFAAPVLLSAGDQRMGAGRLYPSPVLHDMDGDGRADLVIGDLWGKLTIAPRLAVEGASRFGPDKPLLARDGRPLDFSNW